MTPGKFLRLIWPDKGFYCIAHPFRPAGSTNTVYMHKVFATISEAVTHVHEQANLADVYFAVLSLDQERVWDAEKKDYKTGQLGAWATRKQTNMLAAKCSFFDLDVGAEAGKYDTQAEARAALGDFLTKTGLPQPTLISSGGGIHVYWHYDVAMPVAEWRVLAWHMRQLAEGLGLKVDPTRTVDTTSVLRVPDTYNWKDRQNPRPVQTLQEGVVTPVAMFKQVVSDAMVRNGITPTDAPTPQAAAPIATAHMLGTQSFNDFGPPPTLNELAGACAQVREMIASAQPGHAHYRGLDNTAWYRGMLAVVKHVEDGDNWCRKLTQLHPRDNADIEAKLLQLEQFAPARCQTLREYMPWREAPCLKCKFYPTRDGVRVQDPSVPNPIAAARKSTVAPPPVLDPASSAPSAPPAGAGSGTAPLDLKDGATATATPSPPPAPPVAPMMVMPAIPPAPVTIPNPPKPYERLKDGRIALTRTDKDGNETTSIILGHDLYPVKRLVNDETKTEQQVWRANLPRAGAKEFLIDADTLYDGRKFSSALASNGIYPNKADISHLQDYMVAYISQLQRSLDADTQLTHLGWADGYRQFILPDKVLLEDGGARPSSLTESTRRSTQHISKRGDLASQVALMAFYNHDQYLPNQFAILASLGSIIFYATGNHGVVVNLSGESGASKSTTLYTGAGLWGDPALWPINGTQRGATANARTQRIVVNANLPTPVDEITHLPVKDAIDLVMSITQPGSRLRLGVDGAEKATTDSYKSAVMISTANSSLHGLLSTDNAAGTAGSMRVFEMKMTAQSVHTKAEADEFLRQIKEHHGHIGEVFAQVVVRNRVAVERRVQQVMREIDAEGSIQSSERFWSAIVAVVIVAGELAAAMKLLPFDAARIREWAIKVQIPYMRGVVKEEYRDPLAVLTDYIAEKHGNIVVVDRATAIGQNTSGVATVADNAYSKNNPHGALLGHYDLKAGVLYLLKQGFKDHCSRIGATSSRILDELNAPRTLPDQPPRRIVTERAVRRTLGAGTDLAKGQTWCFAIDMTHPEIAGVAPTLATSGGVQTSAPAGKLQVVK